MITRLIFKGSTINQSRKLLYVWLLEIGSVYVYGESCIVAVTI